MLAVTLLLIALCFISSSNCHECFQDWIYYRDSCYGFGDTSVTWGDAQVICAAYGANLAQVESQDENNFLASLSRNKSSFLTWLGGTDVFSEGNWFWAFNHSLINGYTNWGPREPNNMNNDEDCLNIYRNSNYKWNDMACSRTGSFICEMSPHPEIPQPDSDNVNIVIQPS